MCAVKIAHEIGELLNIISQLGTLRINDGLHEILTGDGCKNCGGVASRILNNLGLPSKRYKGVLRIAGFFVIEKFFERLTHSSEIRKGGVESVNANKVGSFRRRCGARQGGCTICAAPRRDTGIRRVQQL